MRQILLFIFIAVMLPSAFGQDKKTKQFLGKLQFVPIKGNYLYMQSAEVSNAQYAAFIFWLNQTEQAKMASIMYPDTLVWRSYLAYNEPYVKYYFKHVAYRDYPVVGISYFQAVAFCNWMADRIMETPEFKASPIEKIKIRLPSEQEWMLAARGGLPETSIYPWEGNSIRWENGHKNNIGKIRLNVRQDDIDLGGMASGLNDAGFITTPVYSYWPNGFGLYNICGNVAELIEDKNKAKGGHWNTLPYNARIDMVQPTYGDSLSTSTVGFRPILEIVSYKHKKEKPLKINAQYLEKQFKLMNDSFGAAIYETTNALYNLYLSETKNIEDSVHAHGWQKYTRYLYYLQYHTADQYKNYPVVNITYESAKHFCEWLTRKYNESNGRKYQQVVFRLPTEKEWELAALGTQSYAPFPWGGPYLRNSKGCYLANFTPLEDQYFFQDSNLRHRYSYPNNDTTISRGVDGAIFTTFTNAYFPNSIGLFQCAGNVAEMTEENGLCKGGSWATSQQYLPILSKAYYTECNAALGFRFFVQIVRK